LTEKGRKIAATSVGLMFEKEDYSFGCLYAVVHVERLRKPVHFDPPLDSALAPSHSTAERSATSSATPVGDSLDG
jgi:hypothetical protein